MKILSLILRIVAILAACAAAALFFMAQGKLDQKNTELAQAQSSRQATQQELDDALGQVTTLQSQLQAANQKAASTERDANSIRSELIAAQQEVNRAQAQQRNTERQVSELRNEVTSLRNRLVSSQSQSAASSNEGEIARLLERVSELETANKELKSNLDSANTELANAKMQAMQQASSSNTGSRTNGSSGYTTPSFNPSNVTLPTGMIGPETTIIGFRSKDGVLTLENNESTQIGAGQLLTLVKGFEAVARVQITEIRRGEAIGHIQPGSKVKELSAGKSVKILR